MIRHGYPTGQLVFPSWIAIISYIYTVHVYIKKYRYVYVYLYVSMYICIYVSMYICIYVYMYMYIYICIYVYSNIHQTIE